MIRTISPNCLKCPTFRAGKCAGTVKRLVATESSPITRKGKKEGDISSIFTTFSGKASLPLPDRFREMKRNLTAGFEEQLQKSWDELVEVLKVRTEEVATKRKAIIPQLNFADIKSGTVSPADVAAIRRTGVAVIRGVVDKDVTENLLADARQYLTSRPFKGFPADSDEKVIYESYWSPSQVKARSHPNMLYTQSWMNQLYTADANQKIDLSVPLTYCDRVQIRPPGDEKFGLPPHVDGGGVERWEDKAYSHTYRKIFEGKWQEFDPWDLTGRLDANMNLYEGPGGCSDFRSFQSWLGLSRHGPQEGTLVVHPILQPATAYWMLRPFFKPTRKDSLDGWKFSLEDDDGSVYLHGSNPGDVQEHTPAHHPHLRLAETMIPYPTVEPGDTGHIKLIMRMVFWSADTIHGTEMKNTGNIDACVFYIPSVPLMPSNAQYVAQQREAFLQGTPPPDFPGGCGEFEYSDRGTVADIQSKQGKVAMGLSPVRLGKDEKSKKLEQEVNGIWGF
ncbi:DUF1479-domain-containing protein [Aspergillus sclerotioniger CBS 115572]|uniref:DUF1479-domain-containing protein n=1 Tax=Aspergillus sclerotioniger CBS 115572 TaxID=1450535 RepID=A0A317XC24_9EURO|nr:DUF1479-domain-containing protein [Aspergillus sclerotioniger CBS 115572]PWY94518.1 DUF1479-domain-containing protein [Aspergillus sclerotioniger CBS 115572]